jgi:predicted transposase/invertase (TIGR01784 family)
MKKDLNGKPIKYSSLRPIYSMNILGYRHFAEDEDALRIFTLYDRKRKKRLDKEYLNIGYFELEKPNIETVNQKHWRDYFLTGTVAETAPDYIKKAANVIQYSNLNKEERKMLDALERVEQNRLCEDHYRDRMYKEKLEKAEKESKEKLEKAEKESKEKLEKAEKESKERIEKTVHNMKSKGLDIALITECTGLSPEQIEKL